MEGIKLLDYKIGLLSIKLIPVLMFLTMWIHTGLLLLNVNIPIASTVAGSAIFPSILILSISRMLKFCWLHKSLVIYSLAVDLCINYQRYIGFSPFSVFYYRLIYFIIGCIILICLIYNLSRYVEKCVSLRGLIIYAKNYKEFTSQDNK